MGDPENQSWESNLGQQWLSRTGQIENFQGFCSGQNFVLFTYLLIDEEILRRKKEEKNIKLLLKKLMIAKVRNA